MRKVNPFKPTAGAEPPVLAGRDAVLNDFEIGLEEGVGAPGRLMRITGPRGSGKTVLLTELGDCTSARVARCGRDGGGAPSSIDLPSP